MKIFLVTARSRLTVNPFRSLTLGGLLMTICIASLAAGDSDEREVIKNPTSFPWYTFVKVRIGAEGNGRGSGVLVSPCTILTNGHVVYDRSDGDFRKIYSVAPGSYYDETILKSVDPFGNKADYTLGTNTGWAETGKDKYDYGVIWVGSSFESAGIDAYIPIAFEAKPNYINVAGYPSEDLPKSRTGATKEQWHGYGDVNDWDPRTVKYEASSSGGQSGGPVWAYYPDSDDRYLVALNKSHTNADLDGKGIRFVSQNEEVIEGWIDYGNGICSASSSLKAKSFGELLAKRTTLTGQAIKILEANALRLADPPDDRSSMVRARRVMQWILGQVYKWEEYTTESGSDSAAAEGTKAPERMGAVSRKRFIRLLKPENRFLTAREAAILLSASRLWLKPPKAASPVKYEESDKIWPVRDTTATREEKPEFVEKGLQPRK